MSCAAGPSLPPDQPEERSRRKQIDFEVTYVEGPPSGALLDALAEFLVEVWASRQEASE